MTEKNLILNIDEIQFHIHSIEHFRRYCIDLLESSDIETIQSIDEIKRRYLKIRNQPLFDLLTDKLSQVLINPTFAPKRDYSKIGKPIMKFTIPGNGPKNFTYASVDYIGNIYVDNHSNFKDEKICVFSPQGKYLFEFSSKPAKCIDSIIYNHFTNELLILTRDKINITVFSTDGRHLRDINKHGIKIKSSIAIDMQGNMLIADVRCGEIKVFDQDENYIRSFAKGHISSNTYIKVLPDGKIAIIEAYFNNTTIVIFGRNYSFLRSIKNISDCGSRSIVDSHGNILVLTNDRDRIFVTNIDNEKTISFGLGSIFNINAIATDRLGRIIVVGRDRIVVF